MIPLQLTIKNFLSYQTAKLDFRGLHTACICGVNGSGKSSLLEAIAWVLWGESRANSDDEVIHNGTNEVQVDFTFNSQGQIYRVIRGRQRGQSTQLELQVAQENHEELSFRSITEKGLRSTQHLIIQHLKLDYETFINSAYLRQGRADEFMLKRPAERKQVLADLLQLDHYDELAEQARERTRQLKAELDILSQTIHTLETQLQDAESISQAQEQLTARLITLRQEQEEDQIQWQTLQSGQQQRNSWIQQVELRLQQLQRLNEDYQQLQQEYGITEQHHAELQALLSQQEAIAQGYEEWLQLQAEDQRQTQLSHQYHQAITQHQHLQEELDRQMEGLYHSQRQAEANRSVLERQHQELRRVSQPPPDLENALVQLQNARIRLQTMDRLHTQVSPLLHHRDHLQRQMELSRVSLISRLKELQVTRVHLENRQTEAVKLSSTIQEYDQRLKELERQRYYQHQVREKGIERRAFMERLQAQQREYETQLAGLEQKIHLLKPSDPEQQWSGSVRHLPSEANKELTESEFTHRTLGVMTSSFPPCPLCDRPLDEHHWHLVIDKHSQQQQDILNQLWVIREQLVVSEREIMVLRQEYRAVETELAQYGSVMEQRGQLQQQWAELTEQHQHLLQLIQATDGLEAQLQSAHYAPELQEELDGIQQRLNEIERQTALETNGQIMGYDEREHALARSEVDRWRWAEIRQAEIQQSQRRLGGVVEQQQRVTHQLISLQDQINQWLNPEHSPLTAQIMDIEHQLNQLGYDPNDHNQLRQSLHQAQSWSLQFQTLTQGQQQFPVIQQRLADIQQRLAERLMELSTITGEINHLQYQLHHNPDPVIQMEQLHQQIQNRRQNLDNCLAQHGQLQAQRHHMARLQAQHDHHLQQCHHVQHQLRIHHELAHAFGKNGIQALLIENVLPQLEAETNQVLARLSGNQFHVQFVTQRSSRRDQSRTPKSKHPIKFIDTLDILIADNHGTRSYETYSGGEAFRINFAIRLALARLLAQRTGAVLQMLIIDEGFGTQDGEGCDRLIGAITAIAADFACILTVTHIPHLKEAFQTRIEVCKTNQGSHLTLVN